MFFLTVEVHVNYNALHNDFVNRDDISHCQMSKVMVVTLLIGAV